MKLKENPVNIVRTEDFKETSFGIRDKRDLVHIFNILRSKMYSNKVLAVLREYSTNAVDAHVLAGTPTKPFKVKLPTNYEPHLEIRDFGPGLTDQEIREIYCMYGASTKRDSNDYNGQLGFGSKSAFAYGDSFQITSYKDGTESIYEAYLDESQLGAIALLQQKPTEEPNGIKITIPVLQSDILNFQNTAKDLYKYFSPQPEINVIELERPVYDLQGKDWGLRVNNHSYYGYGQNGNRQPMAIMGNVAYPISYQTLSTHLKDTHLKGIDLFELQYLLQSEIDLIFGIGELSISASRESLEYDASTINAIVKKCRKVLAELKTVVNDKLNNCKDIVEAKKLYGQLFKGNSSHLARLTNIVSVVWNGIKINSTKFNVPAELIKDNKVTFTRTIRSMYSTSYRSKDRYSTTICNGYTDFEINDSNLLLIKDTNDNPARRKKQAASDAKYYNVWCFEFADDEAKKEFFKKTMIPEKYFRKLSEFQPIPVSTVRTSTNRKHNTKVFKLNQNPPAYRSRSSSEYWSISSVDLKNDNFTYIKIDYFEPYILNVYGLYSKDLLYRLSELDKLLGTSYATSLVGLKPKVFEKSDKFGPGAKLLTEAVKEKVNEKLKDENFAKGLWIYYNIDPYFRQNIHKSLIDEIEDKTSPAYKLWECLNEELKELDMAFQTMCILTGYKEKDILSDKITKEMEILYKKYKESYPLIVNNKQTPEATIEYINAINAYRKSKKETEVLDNDDKSSTALAA